MSIKHSALAAARLLQSAELSAKAVTLDLDGLIAAGDAIITECAPEDAPVVKLLQSRLVAAMKMNAKVSAALLQIHADAELLAKKLTVDGTFTPDDTNVLRSGGSKPPPEDP